MSLKLFLLFLFSSIGVCPGFSQSKTSSSITTGKIPESKFSFVKNWAYKWNIIKDDEGKFSNAEGESVKAADTVHLYYTASCQTNIQGGYSLNYCDAQKKDGTIKLIFTGGQPAYGSEYGVYIKNNRVSFEPNIVYEDIIEGATTTYQTISSKLIITQKNYKATDLISGFVNIEFKEIVSLPKHKPIVHQYYLRGYFKTPVKSE